MPAAPRLAYGNTRDLVLGLEVVLADGRVWNGLRQAAQGQYRLRPEEPVHRLGGHARHRHGRRAEAVSAAARPRHGARRRARPCRRAGALGAGQALAGGGVTAFELMPRIGLDLC